MEVFRRRPGKALEGNLHAPTSLSRNYIKCSKNIAEISVNRKLVYELDWRKCFYKINCI